MMKQINHSGFKGTRLLLKEENDYRKKAGEP